MESDTTPEPKSRLTIDMPSRRKPRGFRIALLVAGVLLLLFVAVIVLLPYFLPIGTIRSLAQSKAKELAGVDLDFKNLHFGWNGDIVLDGITVAAPAPDGGSPEPLLAVDEVRMNVALAPLLSGKAVVNSVDVNGFAVRLIRDAAGRLNLPDFNRAGAPTAALPSPEARSGREGALRLSAALAAEAPAIPPVEIHRVNLRDGRILFTDAALPLELDLGVSAVTVEGGASLDDPFALSGKIHPYREQPDLGAIDFTGTAALLKGGAFNPEGKAGLEATISSFSLGELAEALGLARLLPSALLDGEVKLGYADRRAGLVIPGLSISRTAIGLGAGGPLALPDTRITLDAAYDPARDSADIASASVKNLLLDLTADGGATGVSALAAGGVPEASFDFGGSIDFSSASRYLSLPELGLPELPELNGKAAFSGTAALPAAPAGVAPAPTLTLAFRDGDVHILDNATGISASAALEGITLAANATLAAEPSVHSRLELSGVPVSAAIPQIGSAPVEANLTLGVAFESTPAALAAEIRASGSSATLPATPWSQAANLHDAAAHITADLRNDTVTVHSLEAAVGDSLRARVAGGTLSGVLAGSPRGGADIQLTGLLEHLRQLIQPVYPAALVPQLAGSVRAVLRLKMENSQAEAQISSELDNLRAELALGAAQAELRSPKSTVSLLAALDPANPARIAVRTFEASGERTDVRVLDGSGTDVSGQLSGALVKLSGGVDGAAGLAELSSLSVDVGGTHFDFARGGENAAALSGGLMKIAAGAAEQPVRFPLSASGDFSVPVLDFGMDNLAFNFTGGAGGRPQESHLGNVRARLAADGYIGAEKRQLVNIRTASFSAAPAAVNSRAQMDLGAGSFLAEYAARVAPSGLSSILAFLGLPPALLTNAAATGTVAYDNGRLSSKGAANGELRVAGEGGRDEITPFETAHDLSALWNPADRSLALDVRRLDGSLKTSSGEAVATLAAQPSQLLLSRAGSRGLLDIRVSGSAGPTRSLALGLAGVLPQLRSLAATLASMQAGGLYSAWVQVGEKSPTTLGFNVGGSWKGAALTVGSTPYLSEAGELSAAMEGDLAYQENAVRLSKLLLRSESAQIQAGGTAAVTYLADGNHLPTGLANVSANLQFTVADVALAGRVFPGVLPPALGLAGSLAGTLAASGDAGNVQISQGQIAFRNFRATPAGELEVTIPQGAATFAGALALHFAGAAPGGAPSPYDVFRLFDVNDGRAAVTGALVGGKQVNNLSSAFVLRNGVLTVSDAQVVVGGGADGQIALSGTVDFGRPAPAVDVRVAMRNLPLAEVNSEIRDYLQIRQGALNIPAQQGQSAGVAFAGFSEDEILRTLRLENFTFATGPVTLLTGPVLNAELDKARALMKMSVKEDQSREITLASIDGSAVASGDGVIAFPESRPITVTGDNTADFRAQGVVRSDHTLDLQVMLAGHIEKIFTIPNIAPNLSLAEGGEGRNLMSRMDENAAQGKYGVHVTGSLESPDISGIGQLAMQFLRDVVASVPTQLLGNLIDAPESVLQLGQNIIGGAVHPGETLKNSPENLVRGIGGIFGLGGGSGGGEGQETGQQGGQQQHRGLGGILGGLVGGGHQQQQQQTPQQQEQPQEQQQQQQQPPPERQLLQGIGRMLGGNR